MVTNLDSAHFLKAVVCYSHSTGRMLFDEATLFHLKTASYYTFLICLFRIFVHIACEIALRYDNFGSFWGDVEKFSILDVEFGYWGEVARAELYVYVFVQPWMSFVFVLVFTRSMWVNALVTFLDDNNLSYLVDIFEYYNVDSTITSETDFSDMPELLGDSSSDESLPPDEEKPSKPRSVVADDYDQLVYDSTYGVVPRGVLRRWSGE